MLFDYKIVNLKVCGFFLSGVFGRVVENSAIRTDSVNRLWG
jgi:hypothetical protein